MSSMALVVTSTVVTATSAPHFTGNVTVGGTLPVMKMQIISTQELVL